MKFLVVALWLLIPGEGWVLEQFYAGVDALQECRADLQAALDATGRDEIADAVCVAVPQPRS